MADENTDGLIALVRGLSDDFVLSGSILASPFQNVMTLALPTVRQFSWGSGLRVRDMKTYLESEVQSKSGDQKSTRQKSMKDLLEGK